MYKTFSVQFNSNIQCDFNKQMDKLTLPVWRNSQPETMFKYICGLKAQLSIHSCKCSKINIPSKHCCIPDVYWNCIASFWFWTINHVSTFIGKIREELVKSHFHHMCCDSRSYLESFLNDLYRNMLTWTI